LCEGKSTLELFAWFGCTALDALLLSYGHRVLLLCLGEVLPFRADFFGNVYHLKYTCPSG
jgi:hypothetical protein